jgi:hypothetical protein
MPDQCMHELDEAQRDAAALHDESGKDEERQCQQHEVAGAVDHVLWQRHHRHGVGDPEIGDGAQEERKADRQRAEDGDEEEAERRDDGAVAGEPRRPRGPRGRGEDEQRDEHSGGDNHRGAVLPRQPIDRGKREQGHAGGERCHDP